MWISSPSGVGSAASVVATKLLDGPVADLRPTPRTLIDQGPTRSVYRLGDEQPTTGPVVLLVPPLAAPASCFDLRRGCSLAEHFLARGYRTYLVDYGEISFGDRTLGIEHWVDSVLPRTLRAVSADAEQAPVHLVAWCLGGIFSVLAAARAPQLPIASIATVAAPIDIAAVPLVAPLRPLVNFTGGRVLTPVYRALGGVPARAARWAYQIAGLDKYVSKPWAVLNNLDDREFVAQIEAVDRFMDGIAAYPGRTFGQLYHHFLRSNDLSDGTISLDGDTIDLADVTVPVLAIAGADDGIAPVRAVRRLTEVLTGSPSVEFDVCPGGHLGVLSGRAARGTTWPRLDAFLHEHSTSD